MQYPANKQVIILNPKSDHLRMDPHKFALWLFLGTTFMLFAALTSAYIVKKGDGNWLDYELPQALWYSTALILVSSAAMHWAYRAASRDKTEHVKIGILSALVLGVGFLGMQYYSWAGLVAQNVYFVGNPAGSFLYVFTGLHGLHLVSGIIFLAVVSVNAFRMKIHSGRLRQIEMCATYWHFLGILWVYLFVFLLMNH